MKNNIGMTDDFLIESLEIALAQRTRKAKMFRPGSAANNEIQAEIGTLTLAIATLKSGEPTPLEKSIANKK